MSSKSFVTPLMKQTWVVSGVFLNLNCLGMIIAFPSSVLPAVMAPESDIKMDFHTASWIASCIGVAGIPGFFLASFFMDYIGRRKAHLIMLLPVVSGWLLIYFSSNSTILLCGRMLCGISIGSTTSLGAVCIGEYTDPVHRGVFLNLKSTFVILGIIYVHVLDSLFSWRIIAAIATLLAILSSLISLTWPESPAYLASKKQFNKCSKEFFWLRDTDEKSTHELEELIQAQKNRLENIIGFTDSWKEFFKKFTRKGFLKPVSILVVCMFLMESSGRHVFPAYLPKFVIIITGSKLESVYFILSLDILILISSILSNIFVKVLKRRTLLLSTGILSIISLGSSSIYLFLVSRGFVANSSMIAIILLGSYLVLHNLGCISLPMLFFGELVPLPHRSLGTLIGGMAFSLSMYLTLQMTPYLLVSVDLYGTFAVFSILMTVFLTILYFALPETKDRTLQEIENFFRYGDYVVVRTYDVKEDCNEMDDRDVQLIKEITCCNVKES